MASETESDTRESSLRRLNGFVRRFQQASGFGLRSYGAGVSEALRAHVLVEICTNPSLSVDALRTTLNVAQSSVSRAVKQLKEEGLVKVATDVDDARVSVVRATAAGQRSFATFNAQGSALFERMLGSLTVGQRARLLELQRVFADALGAYPSVFSEQVHPMRKNTFRITRGLNLLRTNLFREFHLSILGWHFLALIQQNTLPLTAKDLCEQFDAATNTVASVIKELEAHRYISRRGDNADRRRQLLALTAKGCKVLSAITDRQVDELRLRVSSMSTDDLAVLVELSEKLLISRSMQRAEIVVSPRVVVRELYTAEEFDSGKRLLLKSFLRADAAGGVPDQVLATSSRCFGLFRENLLQAVAEFRKLPRAGYEMLRFGFGAESDQIIGPDEFAALCYRILSVS